MPVPSDWKSYENTDRKFSIQHPPDLVPSELSGDTPRGELGERDTDFRAKSDTSRAIVVSTFEDNPYGWTLEQFADELYCLEDAKEASLAGERAIRCLGASIYPDDHVAIVLAERDGRFIVIQATSSIDVDEFEAVVRSFKFIQ